MRLSSIGISSGITVSHSRVYIPVPETGWIDRQTDGWNRLGTNRKDEVRVPC